jgi:Zn-dependent alcohol dehydrogenase
MVCCSPVTVRENSSRRARAPSCRCARMYFADHRPVDEFISPAVSLEEINVGVARLDDGTAVRQLSTSSSEA